MSALAVDPRAAALALPQQERIALANRLVASITDPACGLLLARVARSAELIGAELEREQFVEKCRREGL